MVGTCHDAVIKVLEDVLLAEAFVATGHKRYLAQTRCDKCTPCACTAKGVNHTALPVPRHSRQLDRVAKHQKRIIARDIKRDEFAAGRRYVGDQAASARHDDDAKTSARKNAHEFNRACISSADVESRRYDEHRAECGLSCALNNVRLQARFGDWCGKTRHDIRWYLAMRW